MLADGRRSSSSLFYEVKANLRYDQLVDAAQRRHRADPARHREPLRRGPHADGQGRVRRRRTSQLMRWCAELGIAVLLERARRLPRRAPGRVRPHGADHPVARPPRRRRCRALGCGSTGSARFTATRSTTAFVESRPSRAYFYVFPLGRRAMARLAYFFDYDYADGSASRGLSGPGDARGRAWIARPALGAERAPARRGLRLRPRRRHRHSAGRASPRATSSSASRLATLRTVRHRADHAGRCSRDPRSPAARRSSARCSIRLVADRLMLARRRTATASLAVFREPPYATRERALLATAAA